MYRDSALVRRYGWGRKPTCPDFVLETLPRKRLTEILLSGGV